MYKDQYPHLKHYDEAWDLTGITLVHKLYNGTRRYPVGPKKGQVDKIQQWGPYMFVCDGCGTTRQTYHMITKHKQSCKHIGKNKK